MLARALYLLLLLASAAGLPGCDARARPRPNVVLILVDTLRADRMSLYGYHRATTPHLDARARSAVVFEAAHSQASCTFPSVNTLLTSRYTSRFFGQAFGDLGIPSTIPTLAEILGANGYETFAVSASSIVRATPSKLNKRGGYGAGFATFDESCEKLDASCVNARALALARGAGERPFFAYLHYMEPHHPYLPPARYRNHFATPDPTLPAPILAGLPNPILASLYRHKEKHDWTRAVAYLSDSYDDEVRYADVSLDLLLEQLQALTPGRDTVVVLAADHGEDFLEHGELMHCRSLYETSLHVPLVMWLPGVSSRRVATPVQNVDVVPTLLDYLGIAAPDGLDGRSLLPVIDGRGDGVPAFATHYAQRAIIDGNLKLVYDLDTGRATLYDIVADPGETTDLVDDQVERKQALEERLLTHLTATEGGSDGKLTAQLSKQVNERLRALGYLE